MTTNHPAHGPVSLDRLHQIREILSKAAAQSDGGNLGYAMADAVKVIDGAIAAFGVEPVAWWTGPEPTPTGEIESIHDHETGSHSIPLYPFHNAPPAPVVPDEIQKLKDGRGFKYVKNGIHYSVNYANGWNQCRAATLQAGNFRENQNPSTNNCREISETSTNEHVRHEYRASDEQVVMREYRTNHSVWIQCSKQAYERRKAQGYEVRELYERHQAGNSPAKCSLREGIEAIRNSGIPVDVDRIQSECAAGNSPVTPDGWVPVSDRMPDKLIPVMVMYADGEMWSAMWSGQFWDDGCTIPDPHSITHWREMPAAPQQDVKSALEHGMQRYAGAMQKLSEGDD